MICRELITGNVSPSRTNLDRYRQLHGDGRQLIASWLDRAWDMRDCEPEDSFEPFIFTWISFNGWAACITDLDRDRDWMNALAQSQRLCDDFAQFVTDAKSPISIHANEFHRLWPIFKAQAIRRDRVDRHHSGIRQDVVEHYLNAGVRQFEPQCWTRHRSEGNPVPLDWPHTLAALYRVRCNLFHGEKSAHSEMDALVVVSAFRVLINFLKGANYII